MASISGITSGSQLCGSPIFLGITSADISSVEGAVFHRVVLKITAGVSTCREYKMSHQCLNSEFMQIDVSSALRAAGEDITFTPSTTSPSAIKWKVEVWDEYLLDGEQKFTPSVYYPSASSYNSAYMGECSSLDRLLSGSYKTVTDFCRKPTSSPQIVRVGETFAYPSSSNSAPSSSITNISTEGEQQIGDVHLYALPASNSEDNYEFRFINRLGALDSISVHSFRETEMSIVSEEFTLAETASFNSFTNQFIRKQGDYEIWKLSSGPLDHEWQQWFMHEFLMAEHVWMFLPTGKDSEGNIIYGGSASVSGTWVRVHIIAGDSVSGLNRVSPTLVEIPFSVKLDIDGSPFLAV